MNNNSKIKITAVAFAVILVGGMFFIWRIRQAHREQKNFSDANSSQFFSFFSSIGNSQPAENKSLTKKESSADFSEKETYKSAKYNFSFEYPKGFSAAEFIERETTDIILIQNTGNQRGFQIAISPFGGPDLITPEVILKDIPDLKINEPKNTVSNGIRALEFLSADSTGSPRDDGGASKAEIWFIRQGYLYQITAFLKDKDLIEQVLSSWKF